ncbi:zinc ABC transporter substrate-binding protein [Sulfurimonas lithotrophica]|uniref:Zinc ABC transporter substrate-binding protein n=1 Tax=Sulfurimonas lithotrophica TaxID=2590022 RepID=A0A5P8NY12_9BACT|nr:zinc ABC transporter substrate-binding protein [Sulfurimonas lithotrophica]QFR48318.1 zinc ABC transporter substrate-binding protein [Sulfurimonas lithotrophica]
MYRLLVLLLLPLSMFAELKIAVTYPYIGALVKEIAKDNANTYVLAKGNWDPHFVVPRPSLIAKVRRAEGLIINGGELEIGWLPPLIRRASNSRIAKGTSGYLDLSVYIEFLEKPTRLDRADGDVHPQGNPHYHLDPNNILILANVIREFLISLDAENKTAYDKNFQTFKNMWSLKIKEWDEKMKDKKGMKVVQYHNNLAYFNKAYSLNNIGTIEPLPGIPPSSRHTLELINTMKTQKPSAILHDVYHSTKTAQFISSKTGVPIVIMPHDIESLDEIEDLVSLFDYLTSAIK